MPKLIIVRGAPAVGKTNATNALANSLVSKKKNVAVLHWDDVLYFVRPFSKMTDSLAIRVTSCLVKTAEEILKTRNVDFFLIEGVFILSEEQLLLKNFSKNFEKTFCFHLSCPEETLLKRNKMRPKEDFLEEERILTLAKKGSVVRLFDHEKILDTTQLSIKQTFTEIESQIEIEKSVTEKKEILFDSDLWRIGDFLRFKSEDFQIIENVPFHKEKLTLTMLLNFDFPDSQLLYQSMLDVVISQKHSIFLKYIDNSSIGLSGLKKYIKKYSEKAILTELESWEAPIFKIKNEESLKRKVLMASKRLDRTIKTFKKRAERYFFFTNDIEDPKRLWRDCLKIDNSSWKFRKMSHMQGLKREDLKYCLPVLMDSKNCSLCVAYDENYHPQAFSLMARLPTKHYWYAIKWGASDESRKDFVGIATLLWHMEYLFQKEKELMKDEDYFVIDFWGRNQSVYDQIKNDHITRKHLVLKFN